MNNILHDSNLKITSLVQNFMENTLISKNNEFALTNFTDNLQDVLSEFDSLLQIGIASQFQEESARTIVHFYDENA